MTKCWDPCENPETCWDQVEKMLGSLKHVGIKLKNVGINMNLMISKLFKKRQGRYYSVKGPLLLVNVHTFGICNFWQPFSGTAFVFVMASAHPSMSAGGHPSMAALPKGGVPVPGSFQTPQVGFYQSLKAICRYVKPILHKHLYNIYVKYI